MDYALFFFFLYSPLLFEFSFVVFVLSFYFKLLLVIPKFPWLVQLSQKKKKKSPISSICATIYKNSRLFLFFFFFLSFLVFSCFQRSQLLSIFCLLIVATVFFFVFFFAFLNGSLTDITFVRQQGPGPDAAGPYLRPCSSCCGAGN